ncbi:MAG: SDR family oxidoreductase [Actinomycetia bacterium]|nr:SDR family oxidoreductase [Actinomycetes bacterium]MCP4085586.1 SDR family oxidoreductase [Actinomycetes bacterium]
MTDASVNPVPDVSAPFRLDGRVAVVTGASSGFGVRFSKVLAAAGATVVAVARRADRLGVLAASTPGVVAEAVDVADDDALRGLVERTIEQFGRIDVLVNNAGVSDGPNLVEDADIGSFRRVMAVNLDAIYLLSGLCAQSMLEAGAGSIINIASVHGFVGSAPNTQPAYVASKAAVVNLTREMALQWATRGVRVNGIAPGYFETELTTEMIRSESGEGWIKRNTPMKRPGQLAELDGPLLLLASDAGSYMTGHTVLVDGGWTSR